MRVSDPTSLIERLGLPAEVSLSEAAEVLGVDKKTVIRYMRDGVLAWRNVAPPSSSRPTFRIQLESAIKVRTEYRTEPEMSTPAGTRAPRPRGTYQSRFVKIVREKP